MPLSFEKLHILVVEDIYAMQEIIAQMLYAMGVGKVSKAADGEEAYGQYNFHKPDVIITDWHMPKVDGYELIDKIRKDKTSQDRSVPIIMLTGYCSKNRINAARNAGVTEFLAKPFSADELSKRIIRVITNPRDFIATPSFIGPDRRRKEDKEYSGPSNRVKETDRKIKADTKLQKKTGYHVAVTHEIEEGFIEKSQRIIESSTEDFVAMASTFLMQLEIATNLVKVGEISGRTACDEIIYPVMQIKANAQILKYDLAGDLAAIMLDFLEGLKNIDEQVIEIIEAQHRTISHIVKNRRTGTNGKVGENLKKELRLVCTRYMNTFPEKSSKQLVS